MKLNACSAIILAAGEGTRMHSSVPKVLHKIANLPMVSHVIHSLKEGGCSDIAVVTGTKSELVQKEVNNRHDNITFFEQQQRLGTAHAVLAAQDFFKDKQDEIIYIVYGDTPLVQSSDLLVAKDKIEGGADLVIFGFTAPNPSGYGRLLQDGVKLLSIVEEKEASEEQKKITFCNAGLMAVRARYLFPLLSKVDNANSKQEYYLTDLVELANDEGLNVVAIDIFWQNVLGVNTKYELSVAEEIWQDRKRKELMESGVTLYLPKTIYFSHDTEVAPDAEISSHVVFGENVRVSAGAKILSFCHIDGAEVGENCVVGPYARLRPATILHNNVKVGNFCEVKKSSIGSNSKINHLSYIGDSTVGEGVNIGAGVITCNYDGVNKWQTIIGDGAFIGSNCSLVAPVKVGCGSLVAAGSVVVDEVPSDALAIARSYQTNKLNRSPRSCNDDK